jgi:hypothetical protein
MAGWIPAIHVYCCENKAVMPGTFYAKTRFALSTPGMTSLLKSGSL